MTLEILSQIFVILVALLHFYFFILETFLWTTPYGMKVFNLKPADAQSSASLAANQGLYNSFLASGLTASFFINSTDTAFAFQLFFLNCVLLAGIYGALTAGRNVGRKIFCIQALPALIGMLLLIFS